MGNWDIIVQRPCAAAEGNVVGGGFIRTGFRTNALFSVGPERSELHSSDFVPRFLQTSA